MLELKLNMDFSMDKILSSSSIATSLNAETNETASEIPAVCRQVTESICNPAVEPIVTETLPVDSLDASVCGKSMEIGSLKGSVLEDTIVSIKQNLNAAGYDIEPKDLHLPKCKDTTECNKPTDVAPFFMSDLPDRAELSEQSLFIAANASEPKEKACRNLYVPEINDVTVCSKSTEVVSVSQSSLADEVDMSKHNMIVAADKNELQENRDLDEPESTVCVKTTESVVSSEFTKLSEPNMMVRSDEVELKKPGCIYLDSSEVEENKELAIMDAEQLENRESKCKKLENKELEYPEDSFNDSVNQNDSLMEVEEEPSLSTDHASPGHQPSTEVKSWPFLKHLEGNFNTNSGLSRESSDADICAVDSVENSKQDCSMEGSEQFSTSHSPLSYVIQLNDDSECSLPSEVGTSASCPTGFDKILVNTNTCEGENVYESVELDTIANRCAGIERVDSAEVHMDSSCAPSNDVSSDVNTAKKPVKSSKNKNSRVRKSKTKDDLDEKSSQSASRNKQPKKTNFATEVQAATEALVMKKGVFEYQWPLNDKSADWYLLQEHISDFLGVLSFKRKYPDIYRRSVDMHERDFLQEQLVVTEMQCDLGLTALLADEVYDILEKDYPEKFQEYAKVLHKKEQQKVADLQKSSELPTEKTKMETVLKKSVKSAADFNASLMRELRQERRAYFDLQTFEVHYPRSKMCVLPKEATAISDYPVAVLQGQFQDYYKRYTPTELNYFPLNTALYSPHKVLKSVYAEPAAVPSATQEDDDRELQKTDIPPKPQEEIIAAPVAEVAETVPCVEPEVVAEIPKPDIVEEEVVADDEPVESPPKKVRRLTSRRSKKIKTESVVELQSCSNELPKPSPVAAAQVVVEATAAVVVTCSVCEQVEKNKLDVEEDLIHCSSCARSGHPACLDLTAEMIPIIKTYDWQCMECKACVKCMKPHDEEKMMFCDHCDRGYHTFCVDVKEIPEGRWECPSCTLEAATPPPMKPKRGRPFKYPRPVVPT